MKFRLILLLLFSFIFISFNHNDINSLIIKYSTSTSVIDTIYDDFFYRTNFIIKDSLQRSDDGIHFYKKNIVISVDSSFIPYRIMFLSIERNKFYYDNTFMYIESSSNDSVIYLKE